MIKKLDLNKNGKLKIFSPTQSSLNLVICFPRKNLMVFIEGVSFVPGHKNQQPALLPSNSFTFAQCNGRLLDVLQNIIKYTNIKRLVIKWKGAVVRYAKAVELLLLAERNRMRIYVDPNNLLWISPQYAIRHTRSHF